MTIVEDLLFLIKDPNTRVVLLGTSLLGFAAGAIGAFTLLRRRALVGDALAHAALPGICLSYLAFETKSFLVLLLGAAVSCLFATGLIALGGNTKRVTEDTLIGVILSSFFGLGICLSRYIQNLGRGDQAGIESYILGKTASMLSSDALAIGISGALVLLLCHFLRKEFILSSFDPGFALSTGWPVKSIDAVLLGAVMVTTLVGLQAVGVVLVIALLITPSAAARLWTKQVNRIVWLSAIFGAVSAIGGTLLSAEFPNLPTGPLIVVFAASLFILSAIFAPYGAVALLRPKREVISD